MIYNWCKTFNHTHDPKTKVGVYLIMAVFTSHTTDPINKCNLGPQVDCSLARDNPGLASLVQLYFSFFPLRMLWLQAPSLVSYLKILTHNQTNTNHRQFQSFTSVIFVTSVTIFFDR